MSGGRGGTTGAGRRDTVTAVAGTSPCGLTPLALAAPSLDLQGSGSMVVTVGAGGYPAPRPAVHPLCPWMPLFAVEETGIVTVPVTSHSGPLLQVADTCRCEG